MIVPSDIESKSAASLVDSRYLEAAADSLTSHSKLLRSLISQKKMPEHSTSVAVIEALLGQLSLMDSNNFPNHAGAGEREGRVVSSIVARRHFNMSHGIGRSGDLIADQPKAAGSSLMAKICNAMVRDALHAVGLTCVEKSIVVPSCTGMTLALVLQYVRSTREIVAVSEKKETTSADANSSNQKEQQKVPEPKNYARYVIWCRIDQKTCLKCIEAAGLQPVVVELRKINPEEEKQKLEMKHKMQQQKQQQQQQHQNKKESSSSSSSSATATETTETKINNNNVDENTTNSSTLLETSPLMLRIHPDDVAAAIDRVGAENVVCVLSTTSCFSPRLPDDPLQLARVCATKNVPLVVNNAYGTQSPAICKRLNAAMTECGKKIPIASVQSCDKNFLVPVGGSVLASASSKFVDKVAALYAGRASSDPTTDMFITLLELGHSGWMKVQQNRLKLLPVFVSRIVEFARIRGEKVLLHESNDISFAMTLAKFTKSAGNNKQSTTTTSTTWLGGALYRSGISGPRILEPPSESSVACGTAKTTSVGSQKFTNYGMHGLDHTAPPMIIMACAVGMTEEDVDIFIHKLGQLYPSSSIPENSSSAAASASS